MKKLREFHLVSKESAIGFHTAQIYNGMDLTPHWIRVREVSPDLDAAYEECKNFVEAMDYWLCEVRTENLPCCFPKLSLESARAALTKVKG